VAWAKAENASPTNAAFAKDADGEARLVGRAVIDEGKPPATEEDEFFDGQREIEFAHAIQRVRSDLLSFFADRLKVHLREQGARHDLIDAVFALGEDDLVLIVKRVEALGEFLGTDDGKNLLAGYKRAANILAIEEKKDGLIDGEVDSKLIQLPQEAALLGALETMIDEANPAINDENFVGAMKALSKLRGPVDAFFDKVTVNADDKALRLNRLRLLKHIRHGMHLVADFSRIEG